MKLRPKRYPEAASIWCVFAVQSKKLTLGSDTFARHDATGCLGTRSWFVVSRLTFGSPSHIALRLQLAFYTVVDRHIYRSSSINLSESLSTMKNWFKFFDTLFLWLNKWSSEIIIPRSLHYFNDTIHSLGVKWAVKQESFCVKNRHMCKAKVGRVHTPLSKSRHFVVITFSSNSAGLQWSWTRMITAHPGSRWAVLLALNLMPKNTGDMIKNAHQIVFLAPEIDEIVFVPVWTRMTSFLN